MRPSSRWLLVCLSGILAVSCAVPRYTPVTDPAQRLEFRGISILPPQGDDWYFIKGPHEVTYGKKIVKRRGRPAEMAHTFIAVARTDYVNKFEIETPRKLRQFVERTLISADRFKLVEFKAISDTSLGSDCVQYDAIAEEHDNPRFQGFVLLITTHGLQCRHPYFPGLLIHVYYSERHIQGEQPQPLLFEALKHEVEPFLKSLVFAKVP